MKRKRLYLFFLLVLTALLAGCLQWPAIKPDPVVPQPNPPERPQVQETYPNVM